MSKTVFLKLINGSLTELEIRTHLTGRSDGNTEYSFSKTSCRMLIKDDQQIKEELIGIYQEIEGNESSKRFISLIEKHPLCIEKCDIIGIVNPKSTKSRYKINCDIETIKTISSEFDIPILGVES